MPPKKSNLNNARSREARRSRVQRAQQSAEQIAARNAAQRLRTAESRARESQEQRDERLRRTIARIRVARERNIATARVQERQRQRTSRSLTRASFVRLAFKYAPDINCSAHSKIAIGAMDKMTTEEANRFSQEILTSPIKEEPIDDNGVVPKKEPFDQRQPEDDGSRFPTYFELREMNSNHQQRHEIVEVSAVEVSSEQPLCSNVKTESEEQFNQQIKLENSENVVDVSFEADAEQCCNVEMKLEGQDCVEQTDEVLVGNRTAGLRNNDTKNQAKCNIKRKMQPRKQAVKYSKAIEKKPPTKTRKKKAASIVAIPTFVVENELPRHSFETVEGSGMSADERQSKHCRDEAKMAFERKRKVRHKMIETVSSSNNTNKNRRKLSPKIIDSRTIQLSDDSIDSMIVITPAARVNSNISNQCFDCDGRAMNAKDTFDGSSPDNNSIDSNAVAAKDFSIVSYGLEQNHIEAVLSNPKFIQKMSPQKVSALNQASLKFDGSPCDKMKETTAGSSIITYGFDSNDDRQILKPYSSSRKELGEFRKTEDINYGNMTEICYFDSENKVKDSGNITILPAHSLMPSPNRLAMKMVGGTNSAFYSMADSLSLIEASQCGQNEEIVETKSKQVCSVTQESDSIVIYDHEKNQNSVMSAVESKLNTSSNIFLSNRDFRGRDTCELGKRSMIETADSTPGVNLKNVAPEVMNSLGLTYETESSDDVYLDTIKEVPVVLKSKPFSTSQTENTGNKAIEFQENHTKSAVSVSPTYYIKEPNSATAEATNPPVDSTHCEERIINTMGNKSPSDRTFQHDANSIEPGLVFADCNSLKVEKVIYKCDSDSFEYSYHGDELLLDSGDKEQKVVMESSTNYPANMDSSLFHCGESTAKNCIVRCDSQTTTRDLPSIDQTVMIDEKGELMMKRTETTALGTIETFESFVSNIAINNFPSPRIVWSCENVPEGDDSRESSNTFAPGSSTVSRSNRRKEIRCAQNKKSSSISPSRVVDASPTTPANTITSDMLKTLMVITDNGGVMSASGHSDTPSPVKHLNSSASPQGNEPPLRPLLIKIPKDAKMSVRFSSVDNKILISPNSCKLCGMIFNHIDDLAAHFPIHYQSGRRRDAFILPKSDSFGSWKPGGANLPKN